MSDIDFRFDNHGSICVLTPVSEACRQWVDDNVGDDETQHWGKGIVIEPRYAGPILEALDAEGFVS